MGTSLDQLILSLLDEVALYGEKGAWRGGSFFVLPGRFVSG
jgi:hypothetical protein